MKPPDDQCIAGAHVLDCGLQFWPVPLHAGRAFGVGPVTPSLLQRAELNDRILVAG